MQGSITVINDVHEIDDKSGFCTKCGSHEEMIKMDDLKCMYSTNTVAISHRRWKERQLDQTERARNLVETLDHLIKQMREMERKQKEGEKIVMHRKEPPDNAS